jgi:hypothetical protein
MDTIEEKARKYDEVIEKLRRFHDDYDIISGLVNVKEELEDIIPELKDNNYIPRQLQAFLDELSKLEKNTNFDKYSKADCANWITWVNEQLRKETGTSNNNEGDIIYVKDNQENALKDKFHIGEWVTRKDTKDVYLIDYIQTYGCLLYSLRENYSTFMPWRSMINLRPWNKDDIKEGDFVELKVNKKLVSVEIIKQINDDGTFSTHCFLDQEGKLKNLAYLHQKESIVAPATKEEQERLMKAISDNGYEYDEYNNVLNHVKESDDKEQYVEKKAILEEIEKIKNHTGVKPIMGNFDIGKINGRYMACNEMIEAINRL